LLDAENEVGNPAATLLSSQTMSITAIVEKGMIKIPKDVAWASGTVVRVEPVEEQAPTLWETLKDFDGMADDLPPDLAANLDHYLHGHPRT
jgi:hypothetical protein